MFKKIKQSLDAAKIADEVLTLTDLTEYSKCKELIGEKNCKGLHNSFFWEVAQHAISRQMKCTVCDINNIRNKYTEIIVKFLEYKSSK